ncbi:MAG: DUF1858 domain-containing protein [Eubacteriales bacterium]|nr:DUF1858 domain-containing protein [Eubacteriales bacterium]
MRITKNITIGQLLEMDPEIGNILTEIGMHCIGCPSARNETLEQAAEVHGMDADDLIEDIKGFLGA